ncbi:P-II family nitrogen regulator [Patescibacteria group bacterium]
MFMEMVKIVVFTPKSHTDAVRQAIGDAGAGKIGNYNYCSYSVDGVGRYKPMKGAKPFIGEVDKLEKVNEERIECVCEKNRAKEVISAIRKVHPYEEVAFDIYPLIFEEEL